MTNALVTISVKLPASDLLRIPARNRSAFVREAVREKLASTGKHPLPKTPFGRKLASLRGAHVAGGATLLSQEEVLQEIRERRGGMA